MTRGGEFPALIIKDARIYISIPSYKAGLFYMQNNINLFVYGSLQRGLGIDSLLKNSVFLGDGITVDKFLMFDLGSFPGIVKDSRGKNIFGEVYQINQATLDILDIVESHPDSYTRKMFEIQMEDEAKECWIYEWRVFYNKNPLFRLKPIQSDDWRAYKEQRKNKY